jgi:hypothetical protein
MPKEVDDLVKELLADPDFYPEKSEKAQEATAWAISWSQYNKKKKKKKNKKKASFNLKQYRQANKSN